jgi:hypothetical protein
MRRAIALTALAVALGVALTGCRGNGVRDARPPAGPDTASTVTTPAPAPKTAAPADAAAAVNQADKELADLDRLLAELDGQLKKAEETPTDED